MEIEKKFRVKKMPEGYEELPHKRIEQGYLCTRPTVRIRKIGTDYVLTLKDKQGVDAAEEAKAGIINREIEIPLTEKAYSHLKEKTDGYPVEKTRYFVPLPDGLTAELDVFEGRLSGLVFAEVEFPDVDAAERFQAPDWMAEEVSDDKRYRNSSLSLMERYDAAFFSD